MALPLLQKIGWQLIILTHNTHEDKLMKNKNIFIIIGICLLILAAYWHNGLKDFKRGKFFYMAEGQLIYSYGAGFLGLILISFGLFDKDLNLRKIN